MSHKRCSIVITTPGEPEFDKYTGEMFDIRNPHRNLYIKRFIELLDDAAIDGHWCDTIPGYWNLNQEWYEFQAVIDPSWGYCTFTEALGFEANKEICTMLIEGHVIMMIFYIETDEEGKERHVPHN